MINLRNSPFLWISLMLLLSFWLTGKYFPVVEGRFIVLLNGVCFFCAAISIIRYAPKSQYLSSITIGVLIFICGIIRFNEFNERVYGETLIHEPVYVQAILETRQVLKNKDYSVSLRGRAISFFNESTDQELNIEDQFFLVFIKTDSPRHFLPGDVVRVYGWLSAIKAPLNPNAFDARVYYNTMGIRHQLYCKSENLQLIDTLSGFSIARITACWQSSLTDIIRKNTSGQVAQLTNALMWGDRSDMDSEVRDAFADTGAMHVLSVSGMHVAIIYSMLLLILGPPGAGPFFHRLIRFIVYTFAIVLYMGLTGACPAVVRAGLMIILYLFGKSMGWNTQIWNLLGFAAFVMLWINPHVWQNIGFQLSFLAMAGILLFAKPIIRSVSFRFKLMHLSWEITALSIAAQVFIIPILLRQFHQFPLTFIVSSIVAIPAAYVVMFGALLNTVLSFVGIDYLWAALDWIGKLFISVMQWMSGMNPLMHFSLPSEGSLLLMMMGIFFSIGLVFKWSLGKKIAWTLGLLAFVSMGYHRYCQWTMRDLVIYHSNKGLIIDVIADGFCYTILDCSLSPASIAFMTRGFRCERDIINVYPVCLHEDFEKNNIQYEKSILTIGDRNFCIWNDQEKLECVRNEIDYLIIEKCSELNALKEYLTQNQDVTVILTAQVEMKMRKMIKDFIPGREVQFHDVDTEGYFRMVL